MLNFSEARNIAFQEISKFESVLKIDPSKAKIELGLKFDPVEIWEIETEIGSGLFHENITLHVGFEKDFPLSFPRIYLSKKDYERFKYLPHINTNRFICVYDTEYTFTIPELPHVIVYDSIRRAKGIILDGLQKKNFKDFEDEFVAYWENSYAAKDKVLTNVLSLLTDPKGLADVEVFVLQSALNGYKYVLHQNDIISERFKQFLEWKEIKFESSPALFLGNIKLNDSPPYNISYSDSIKIVKELSSNHYKAFKNYLNKLSHPKCVVFERVLNGNKFFLGWLYELPTTPVKGFRPGVLSTFEVLSKFSANQNTIRILPEDLTPKRLLLRTEGESKGEKQFKFAIAGLGSVGSHLTYLLNTLDFPEFRLIDNDVLKIENIGRHFLGFSYVNAAKTLSLKNFFLHKNPIQQITTKETSIVDILETEINYLNEADYIFLAVGKLNIEKLVADYLKSGQLTKPVFILWVEPYLAGGHCVFLNPQKFVYKELFNENLLYRNNIIADNEYIRMNPKLSLTEAGCQTSFIPYSGNNVVNFLGGIFNTICTILNDPTSKSSTITWVGNLELLKELSIEVSDYALPKRPNEVCIETI